MINNTKEDLEQVDRAWNKLEPLLEEQSSSKLFQFISSSKLYAIAAILFLVTTSSILFYSIYFKELTYTTKFGETKKLILPDQSVVYLNGNSKLSYNKHWLNSQDRVVKVEGEAFFSVQHTQNNQKFFVRMTNHSSVEVLGTEFNIQNRDDDTKVTLNSGKIKFHIADNQDVNTKTILMNPGELVEYESSSNSLTKKLVEPANHSSWKNSKLIFEKTELKEIINLIKNTYGLNIKVNDPELFKMKVSGSAPSHNIDILVKGLSEIFELNLIVKGDSLFVSPINPN
jgi:ferric-dicitrate binding protein FerR (iron transport regulator)